MASNKQRIQQYLITFDFTTLFIDELGWEYLREAPLLIMCNGQRYLFCPLAEKRGVKVYTCEGDAHGLIPDDVTLRTLEREITKHAYEHILIYTDAAREQQVWQWVKRETGKPLAYRQNRLSKGQSGDLLAQKLQVLTFEIGEEEHLQHTVQVAGRVAKAFDVEHVTKRFYDRFKKEHSAFLAFIQGIETKANREWYASLMLNRLMFVYFIQRQGFLDTKKAGVLDGDRDYLANRLQMVRQCQGNGSFHSFYRYFLLQLFHQGLSKQQHTPELDALLGKVPYLNGGLFDVHELERSNADIQIPDEAFENIFAFLDEFDWHLDNRPMRTGKEINPDVLGNIFEQYINQKQMGAYYTKEDITEYISRNTILPSLFDATEKKYPHAFHAESPLWHLLRDHPDRYIYSAVKKGMQVPLPAEIEAGIHDIAKRATWNKPAPEAYALPTEIWREVVARRMRYEEIRAKLHAGEIASINDLITYNLDIRQFVQDVLVYTEDAQLLVAFYEVISQLTVLDPTCGSGAFLFAALTLLEPLYQTCLERMQSMVEHGDRENGFGEHASRFNHPAITTFREILQHADAHTNRRYFILKSIIINNLYGVDIMEEATEICKLRLFLKLISTVEKFDDIEPLPDIDFNIRAGNTLVGFANYDAVRTSLQGKEQGKGEYRGERAFQNQMHFDNTLERIEQKAQEVECGFQDFRERQTRNQCNHRDVTETKLQLRVKVEVLRAELDRYLAREYGIDRNTITKKEEYERRVQEWQQSHQPFHWFVEFYGIMQKGGFDVVVGNPPYIEYRKVKQDYVLQGYKTLDSGNIYAAVLERSFVLCKPNSYSSFIVPISAICTERTTSLQTLLSKLSFRWYAAFDVFPSRIFEGAAQRLAILILTNTSNAPDAKPNPNISTVYTSKYHRWYQHERINLMSMVTYGKAAAFDNVGWLPRVEGNISSSILKKLQGKELRSFIDNVETQPLYVHRIINNFIKAVDFIPYFKKASGEVTVSDDFKKVHIQKKYRLTAMGVLNSSLFYWYWRCHGDGFHCGYRDIERFPLNFDELLMEYRVNLDTLARKLGKDLEKHSEIRVRNQAKTGKVELQTFFVGASKFIIDEVDCVLAKHYGFTEEELDFIINYDIKYRMGRESEE